MHCLLLLMLSLSLLWLWLLAVPRLSLRGRKRLPFASARLSRFVRAHALVSEFVLIARAMASQVVQARVLVSVCVYLLYAHPIATNANCALPWPVCLRLC